MSLIVAATAVFIIISPFINAGINRVNWSPKTKSLVAWGTAFVIGTAYVLLTGGIANIAQLFIAAPAIYGATQAIYQFILKNVATKFEALTTPGSIVVSPSGSSGSVDITSDATITATGDNITVDTPVQINSPVEFVPEEDVKG